MARETQPMGVAKAPSRPASLALALALAAALPLVTTAAAFPSNCSANYSKQSVYSVAVLERSAAAGGGALISRINGSSAFNFSFTTAWVASPSGSDGLIVRVVECNPNVCLARHQRTRSKRTLNSPPHP